MTAEAMMTTQDTLTADVILYPGSGCDWPDGFEMAGDGLWTKEDNQRKVRLCGPFTVEAATRSQGGGGWGLLIAFSDPDGRRVDQIIERAQLLGDGLAMFQALADGGLWISPKHAHRQSLQDALSRVRTPRRAILTQQAGWCETVFALSRETTFGPDDADPVILLNSRNLACEGSISEWREAVAAHGKSNPLLTLAISAAFTGPCLELLGAKEGMGLHFRGPSSCGKTTLAHVAAGVWGLKPGSWRATSNGLEAAAAAANDGLLVLDEIGQADAKDAADTVYMLANGAAKARMTKTLAPRQPLTWRTVILSTGEIGLAAKVADYPARRSKAPPAGLDVRLVDVEAPPAAQGGAFPDHGDFTDSAALADHLKAAAAKNAGAPIRAYLQKLVAARDEARERLEGQYAQALDDFGDVEAGQPQRVAHAFARVAAAGELATGYGLTGWKPGDAIEAARMVFEGWRAHRGPGSGEDARALDAVRAFLLRHQSRFALAGDDVGVKDRPDIAGVCIDCEGNKCFGIWPEVFRDEVVPDLDPVAAAKALRDAGFLVDGDGDNLTCKVKFNGQRPRAYVVRAAILNDGGDEDAPV